MQRSTTARSIWAASAFVFATSPFVLPSVFAQVPNPTVQQGPSGAIVTQDNGVYLYRVQVVQRDLDAVNYLHRSGSTHIGFKGTTLLPGASGDAKVTSERGVITVDAHFKGLTPANSFGREYLTYVLWAISPDGRPQNLGEILPDGSKNDIKVTTAFQAFGLIVTAEPYFAVSQPSDVVVLQNYILEDKHPGRAGQGECALLPSAARPVFADRRSRHGRKPHHAQREVPA